MRFIFVDAENIGLKEVEAINASIISDKVLVFSKNDTVKEVCERKLFLYISSYPTGSNQADFYIIGNLLRIIASLKKQQLDICQFVLYSQDNSLVTAFAFQCKLHKLKHRIALKSKAHIQAQPKPQVIEPKKTVQNLEQKIYEHFKTEQTIKSVLKKFKH